MDSFQSEKAGGILPGHHVDLGLAEALFCEDSQSHLKGVGMGDPAGLAEIGGQHDVFRTECSNIRNLLGPVVDHWILSIHHLGSSTRWSSGESLPTQHDLD